MSNADRMYGGDARGESFDVLVVRSTCGPLKAQDKTYMPGEVFPVDHPQRSQFAAKLRWKPARTVAALDELQAEKPKKSNKKSPSDE